MFLDLLTRAFKWARQTRLMNITPRRSRRTRRVGWSRSHAGGHARYGTVRPFDGVADLRTRSGRNALLATDADHPGQREPAAGGVGVPHAAPGASPLRQPQRRRDAAGAAAVAAGAGATGPWAWPRTRRLGVRRPARPRLSSSMASCTSRTPYGRVVALDPDDRQGDLGLPAPDRLSVGKGCRVWPGDAKTPPQIVFGTGSGRLYSVHAKTGEPNAAFGDHGSIDLEHA